MSTGDASQRSGAALPVALAVIGGLLLLLKAWVVIAFAGEDEPGYWVMVGASSVGGLIALGGAVSLGKRASGPAGWWLAGAALLAASPELVKCVIGVFTGHGVDLLRSDWLISRLKLNIGVLPLALAALIAFRRARRERRAASPPQAGGDW